jgi:hypothetical protein
MPTNITPSQGFNQVRAPLDGEPASAADLIALTVQPLANRAEGAIVRIPGANPTGYIIRASLRGRTAAVTNWTEVIDSTGRNTTWRQNANSITYPLQISLTDLLPPDGRISRFGVYCYGVSGHGALPQLPSIYLMRKPFLALANTAPTQVTFGNDLSNSVAAYQTPHTVEYSPGTPHSIQYDNDYQIFFFGEEGVNYVNGLVVTGVFFEVIR